MMIITTTKPIVEKHFHFNELVVTIMTETTKIIRLFVSEPISS